MDGGFGNAPENSAYRRGLVSRVTFPGLNFNTEATLSSVYIVLFIQEIGYMVLVTQKGYLSGVSNITDEGK